MYLTGVFFTFDKKHGGRYQPVDETVVDLIILETPMCRHTLKALSETSLEPVCFVQTH